jgi:hypothetical protein
LRLESATWRAEHVKDRLLAARRQEQPGRIVQEAPCQALDTPDVIVSLTGVIPETLRLAKVPEAGEAAIGVSGTINERSMQVVEAAAGLLGMALQRLNLEEELSRQ